MGVLALRLRHIFSLFSCNDNRAKQENFLRYFVSQVPITLKMLNGYLMFYVKNIVQNVKLIKLWEKKMTLHFVISKISFF